MVKIPTDRQVFEGEIATYWLDDDGILVSLSKNPKRTVANIAANVALVKQITNNQRVPLLIYLSNSPVPDKATRQVSTEQLPQVYTAMAMIADSSLVQLIMNLLFKFQSPPIPMKNFTDVEAAKAWLKQYR